MCCKHEDADYMCKKLLKFKQISKPKTSFSENPCLFSFHNITSSARHEQVCLMRLRFERYFSHHWAM